MGDPAVKPHCRSSDQDRSPESDRGEVSLVLATTADSGRVTDLARCFHAEDGHPLTEAGLRALLELLRKPEPGLVLMIADGGLPVGYAVLCFGYSIEWGGRDAFLDDFYIVPEERGRGLGAVVIESLAQVARAHKCSALHLEVVSGNRAQGLYRRAGFRDRGSAFLTRPLAAPD